ncbi:MAG: hypothetical protein Q7T20_14865 [Saprospiraceae bacterium]|nr:hypothetical protein [Saprospiraceae bacterium]
MKFEKTSLIVLLLISTTAYVSAQVKTIRRYNPSATATTPKTYSTETVATPKTYSTETTGYSSDAATRRAKALSKVQRTPVKSLTAKGAAPAQYSTDATTPATYATAPIPATTFTVNGVNVHRKVRKGEGQVGDLLFTPIIELHYVQFAVYCKNTPVDKAPPIEGLMLIWHEGTKCPGGEEGACYIVKGFDTAEDAKSAVLRFKGNKIDCWYNPALTGAAVEVIGVRS